MGISEMNLSGRGKQSVPKSQSEGSGDIIGIDLGTTNSAVAVYNAGTVPTLLPIGGPNRFTVQSCVRWDGGDNFTVGEEAYNERYKSNVIYSVKRIMGSGKEIFLNRGGPEGCGETIRLTPSQVSGEILKHIRDRVAELYRPVTRCIITVPAYFNQLQIEDTVKASEYAGLECIQILKEPTSASYIYSQLGYAQNGSVLIYDLGGGTFDVTHMNFLRKDSIPKTLLTSLRRQYGIELNRSTTADVNDQYFCRVLGTYGDVHLGGDDIDQLMGDSVLKNSKIELSDEGREKLYLRCENFKKMSANAMDVIVEGKKIHLSSSDLDEAVDTIFARTMALMSEIDMSDVSTIVLVGGSTKSQRIRDNLSRAFPKVEISAVLDPDATVALGAGSVAKAVASKSGLMYADVLPLPIGILVNEKEVKVCIPRNTSMPYVATENFYTLHDNQSRITLHVFQGLSENPAEDTYLGKLVLDDIPQAPAGELSVAVSFMLNDQGRLRIVSSIDGRDKDVELVVDNIFDVKNISEDFAGKSIEDAKSVHFEEGSLVPSDDFEECFMPLCESKAGAHEQFVARRSALKSGDSAEVERIEAVIFGLAQ